MKPRREERFPDVYQAYLKLGTLRMQQNEMKRDTQQTVRELRDSVPRAKKELASDCTVRQALEWCEKELGYVEEGEAE